MKKTIIAIAIIFTSLLSQAQTKDSIIYKPDSVATISITDLDNTLKYIEDKVTKKEYDSYFNAYRILLQLTEQKRRIIKTKKQ